MSSKLHKKNRKASAREVEGWLQTLDVMLSHDVWKHVGIFKQFPSNSQVLQKKQGYREILKFDISLRLGLKLPWDRGEKLAEGIIGDIRPINELYEYWCFFHLKRILSDICEQELPHDGSLFTNIEDGFELKLEKGKKSKLGFIYKETEHKSVKINLYYNKRFQKPNKANSEWQGSYTAQFDPDYSVEITVKSLSTNSKHWLHFDAKYRVEISELESIFDSASTLGYEDEVIESTDYEKELSKLHKQDDLFKMHTYRDGILSSRGAYILFPGQDSKIQLTGKHQNIFVRHPSAFGGNPSRMLPSIGAFSLSPGKHHMQIPTLSKFLSLVINSISTYDDYHEEGESCT